MELDSDLKVSDVSVHCPKYVFYSVVYDEPFNQYFEKQLVFYPIKLNPCALYFQCDFSTETVHLRFIYSTLFSFVLRWT